GSASQRATSTLARSPLRDVAGAAMISSASRISRLSSDIRACAASQLCAPSPHVAAFNWVPLANQGVDTRSLQHYLGHKNIQHTVRYSELSPERFRDFWKD